MFPDFCSFPCLGSRSSDDTDSDRDPVLLVSGIGGSIFNSKGKKYGCETRVWVRLLLAEFEFKKKVWSVYNPKTGYTEALDKDSEIVVPDDDYGLYAIDILDPSWFIKILHISAAYHFHDMIDMLLKCGYKKGTTLFGYGYDFRQSNRFDKLMEGLKAKLETAYSASGCRKVNIISHSMGGLLVSCFMSLHREVFTKFVNKWICIACPFQGAPGCINDSLLTGMQFVEGFENNFFISRWTMHQLLVECPSIYEMLANPDFKWEKQPEIQVWRKQKNDGETCAILQSYDPFESFSFFEDALRNNELGYNGNTISLPFNFSILKWAFGTRHVLNNAQLPETTFLGHHMTLLLMFAMVQRHRPSRTCLKCVTQCLNILTWMEMELFPLNQLSRIVLLQLKGSELLLVTEGCYVTRRYFNLSRTGWESSRVSLSI